MQVNTMLCLDMSKCQFDMENFNVIPIIRTNYHSSAEVIVLSPWGGEGVRGGGQAHAQSDITYTQLGHKKNFIASDWTKIQDGKWKADI